MEPNLLVVSRQERALYASLVRHFADEPDLRVVLDRRQEERRQHVDPGHASPERRRAERRGTPHARARLAAVGFTFVPGR